jgi:DNA (cytosine-5)-methyltransferase 1
MKGRSMLTHGSLCTGYGGLDDAVDRVFGSRLVWWSDIDPGPIAVMEHHAPGVPNIGDLKTAEWHDVLVAHGPIDILTAGYPCQPFSNAGKRLGTDDPRHLWPYIAYAVGVLRPGLLVLENVAAHLKRGFDVVLADLAALGYDASWAVVRASEVGAPHRRDRLFVVAAHAHSTAGGERWQSASGQAEGGWTWPDAGRPGGVRVIADTTGDGRHEGRTEPTGQLGRPDAAQRGAPAAADADVPGLEGHRTRRPQTRRWSGTDSGAADAALAEWWAGRLGLGERLSPEDDFDDSGCVVADWGDYGAAIERWERIRGLMAPAPTEKNPRGKDVLSPAFVEWMMGLEPGHVTGVPGLTRNLRLKLLGNGVVPQQAEYAIRALLPRLFEDLSKLSIVP